MKAFITLTLTLLVLLSTSVIADEKGKDKGVTSSLEGTVIDKSTGETLAGVEVKLEGTNMKCVSDLDGKFKFESLTPGEYKIDVSYISYKKNKIEIEARANELAPVKIELESL